MTALSTVIAVSIAMSPLDDAREALVAGEIASADSILRNHWSEFHDHDLAEAFHLARRVAFRMSDIPLSLALAEEEVMVRISLAEDTSPVDTKLCRAIEIGFAFSGPAYLKLPDAIQQMWIDLFRSVCAIHPEEEPGYSFLLARQANDQGLLFEDWKHLTRTLELATRQGDILTQLNARASLASLAGRLGRPDYFEQSNMMDPLQLPQGPGLEAVDVLALSMAATYAYLATSWSILMLRESGYHTRQNLNGLLEEVRRLTTTRGPGFNPRLAALTQVYFGLDAIQDLRPDDALKAIRGIDSKVALTPDQNLWRAIVETRAFIRKRKWTLARRSLDAVDRWAEIADGIEWRWIAKMTHGLVHEVQGDVEHAYVDYIDADRLLDQLVIPVAFGEMRDHYIHDLQRRSRSLVSLQLRMGLEHEALCTVRRARGRVYRAFEAQSLTHGAREQYDRFREKIDHSSMKCHMQVSAEQRAACAGDVDLLRRDKSRDSLESLHTELRDPRVAGVSCEELATTPGEVLLVLFELADGWHATLAADGEIRRVHLGSVDFHAAPEALASTFLEPFAEEIERATRIKIAASEAAHEVAFHVLPWREGPLIAHVPVVYSLDLPSTFPATVPASEAIVVAADNTATLSAENDALLAYTTLDSLAGGATLMEYGRATRAEVVDLLKGRSTHFYFGGHGGEASGTHPSFDRDLWDTTIVLDGETRLSAEDILMNLRPGSAPAHVFLLACSTGRVDRTTASGGIGLAQAFLLRGSEMVVATTQPVKDSIASALSREIYESFPENPAQNLIEHVAAAHAALHARKISPEELGNIRIFVR